MLDKARATFCLIWKYIRVQLVLIRNENATAVFINYIINAMEIEYTSDVV